MLYNQIEKVLEEAKLLAIKYKKLTGKPLGITGEIGEFTAAKILHLKLSPVRQVGFDAIDENQLKIQIKSRCLMNGKGGNLGRISSKHKWDKVILVILDSNYEPVFLYEANRKDIIGALNKPGSKSRNERGQLSINKFRMVGKEIWNSKIGLVNYCISN